MKNLTAVALMCTYIIVTSLPIYNLSHVFVHVDNLILSTFIWYHFNQKKTTLSSPKPIFLAIFPLSIIAILIVELFIDEENHLPIHVLYVLVIHVFILLQIRASGGRMLSFTVKDYVMIYPMILFNFILFGLLFLSKIPENSLVLTMAVTSILMILMAHVLNRKTNRKNYAWGIIGGFLFMAADLFMAYDTFIEKTFLNTLFIKLNYYLGLFFIIDSLLDGDADDLYFPKEKPHKKVVYSHEAS